MWKLTELTFVYIFVSTGKFPVSTLVDFPWALSWESSWASSGAFYTENTSAFVGISVDIFVYSLVGIFVSTFVREFVGRISRFACSVLFWKSRNQGIFRVFSGIVREVQGVFWVFLSSPLLKRCFKGFPSRGCKFWGRKAYFAAWKKGPESRKNEVNLRRSLCAPMICGYPLRGYRLWTLPIWKGASETPTCRNKGLNLRPLCSLKPQRRAKG